MSPDHASSSSGGPHPPHKPVKPEIAGGPALKSGRRALSCTECKRRKTKCSALGKTPCDACVKRGKPGDCVWLDASDQGRASFALTTELDTLRSEVKELRALLSRPAGPPAAPTAVPPHVHAPQQTNSAPASIIASPDGANAMNGSQSSPSGSSPATAPGGTNTSSAATTTSPTYAVESAVTAMEDLVVGPLPGTRFKTRAPSVQGSAKGSPVAAADHNRRRSSGGDHGDTTEDAVRNKWLLEAIHYTLPDPTVGKVLLDEYFDGPVHKGWKPVDHTLFMKQFQTYASLSLDERRLATDPAWLALYLSMLALAVKFLSAEDLLHPVYSAEDVAKLPATFYQASLNALEVANYLGTPQLYHVQAALHYVLLLFHFGDSQTQANHALRHFDAAVTTLQWLNLDILTDDPTTAPLDDPALEGLSPIAAHELCRRIVHMYSFMDGAMQKRPGTWRMGQVTTPLPSNKNLSEVDGPERPAYEYTEATIARVGSAFGNVVRHHHLGRDLTFDEVVEYDRGLRMALNVIPPTNLSLDHAWMIYIIFCSIHNRLQRIHRPHMTLGYTDPARGLSRVASVDSAKRIIEIQKLFDTRRRLVPNFVKRWIMGAAFVLAVDYMLGNASSRLGLAQALDLFTQPNPEDRSPEITREGVRTIEALLEVADSRVNTVRAATVEQDLNELLDEVRRKMELVVEPLPLADFDFDQFFATLQGFDLASVNALMTPSQIVTDVDPLQTQGQPLSATQPQPQIPTQPTTHLPGQGQVNNYPLPPIPLYHTLLPPGTIENWPPAPGLDQVAPNSAHPGALPPFHNFGFGPNSMGGS